MPRPPLHHGFLDDEFVAATDARVSVFDRGFLFGDGVYEVIPVYHGKLFHADAHLKRLRHSLAGIELEVEYSDGWWLSHMKELVSRNGGGDQSLYLQVTRGAEFGRDHRFPPPETKPTVFMYTTGTPPRDPDVDANGISAVLAEDNRWARCDLKVISLLANVLLRQHAADRGADEVILHRRGRLTEASISNVYVVRNGVVNTPALGKELLPGITREVVLGLCRDEGIEVVETDVTTSAFDDAEEVWVSSSTRELAPITELEGEPVGDGKPGPLYRRVREAFDKLKV